MAGIIEFIQNLFSSSTNTESNRAATESGEEILEGTDAYRGVETIRDELLSWKENYSRDYQDFLTVREALTTYQRAQSALDRLTIIREHPGQFDSDVVEAAETLHSDLEGVTQFIESRESYNKEWVNLMQANHADDLNSYFEDEDLTHTEQQFQAIFRNDNFNRVNAAAGTGKTTTFGRRVNFILSEFDDVAASDLLAITFSRGGVKEMEKEQQAT